MVWPLVIAAVGAGLSMNSASKASKQSKRQNELQRKINKLTNKQAKRSFMRQFRQAQGAALQQGISAGLGIESSAIQGALASEKAQLTTALGDFREFDRLGAAQTDAMNKQSTYGFQSQVWGQVSSFASGFIS